MRERIPILIVVLPLVAVSGLVAWYARAGVPGYGEPGVTVLNLTGVASEGVWTLEEVNGLNYWWKRFEPAVIHVGLGDEVVLNLRSADLFHRFYLPVFDVGPVDVEPGHRVTVRFRADRAGVFQYYCTSMCGSCHFYMRGWFVVTAPGEEVVQPPPITCRRCFEDFGPRPEGEDLEEVGAWLYLDRGCGTCHGPEGRGGIANPNSANSPVPAHDTTAQKLFLASPEDVEAMIALVTRTADLEDLDEEPEIDRFPIVRTRFLNAREIIRGGRYSTRQDPDGPEPPLQMPAWEYLVDDRDIDALLVYFLSLERWDDDETVDDEDVAAALGLTDLALWPGASWSRHPSQADLFAPHGDSPGALEHFPAGSFVPPPPREDRR